MSTNTLALAPQGLGAAFLASAMAAADRLALADSSGAALSYRALANRALALALLLERSLGALGPRIGVCLPPGEAAALVNVALALTPMASVNLNALSGAASLRAQIAQAGLLRVITSQRLGAALGGEAAFGETALFVEDLLAQARVDAQALEQASAGLQPHAGADARVATVLFSSGSTSKPKAIQLSHGNVASNARAMAAAFDFGERDRILGVLPLFHSFGYTVTLWAPLLSGASVVFHDNPLDARAVGEIAARHRPTLLLATPALYQAWMRRVEREQFSSVRAAVVGAQRLQPTLAAAWQERFGAPLYEGYGCTELSPVVSANLPEREGRSRARAGSVGLPLPGVEIQVREPRTGRVLPAGTAGDVWVRGPNVMLGYLDDEAATSRAIVDGWYDTQDVGSLDAEGYLTLSDRRSRFSKLGGEMVSHAAVELALAAAAVSLGEDASKLGLAVTALDDEQRGERLVVLHTPLAIAIDSILERARRDGLANLFTPRARDCFAIPALPYLASGKLDLGALKRLAQAQRADR